MVIWDFKIDWVSPGWTEFRLDSLVQPIWGWTLVFSELGTCILSKLKNRKSVGKKPFFCVEKLPPEIFLIFLGG